MVQDEFFAFVECVDYIPVDAKRFGPSHLNRRLLGHRNVHLFLNCVQKTGCREGFPYLGQSAEPTLIHIMILFSFSVFRADDSQT